MGETAQRTAGVKFRAEFSRAADRDIKRLSANVRAALPKEVDSLIQDPRQGKPLRGVLKGIWRHEFNHEGTSYRIAYRIIENRVLILILMVGSRENFYARLRRRLKV